MIFGSNASLTIEELDGFFASNPIYAGGNIWCAMRNDSNYSNGIAVIEESSGSLVEYNQCGVASTPNENRLSTDGTYVFFTTQGDDIRRFSVGNPSVVPEIVSISYTTVDSIYKNDFLWVLENTPVPRILKISTQPFGINATYDFNGYTSFDAIFHDGNHLWVSAAAERVILKINPSNGIVLDTCSMGNAPDVFNVAPGSIVVSDSHLIAVYRNAELDGTLLVARIDDLDPSHISAPTLIDQISPLGDYWWAAFDQAVLVNNQVVLSFRHYFNSGGEDNGNAGGVVAFDPVTETITDSVLINDGYNELDGTIFGLSEINDDTWYNFYIYNPPTNTLRYIQSINPPTVTGLSPSSGLTPGGNTVNISGTSFSSVSAVYFGANNASFAIQSDTSISAIAPAGSAGQVDVTVTAPSGTSATSSASKYTYLTSIATGGTTITISDGVSPPPPPVPPPVIAGAASGGPLPSAQDLSRQAGLTDPLEHPFRFVNGKIPKVKAQGDQHSAQRIASAARIGFGELSLRPLFGGDSPEFTGFKRGSFLLTCGSYFPDIRIIEAEQTIGNDGKSKIEITFTRNE